MIKENDVVKIEFTLSNDKEVIETTKGDEPFEYIQGAMEILPALEKEMEGKKIGDSFSVTIKAEDAYGERNDDLTEIVGIEEFEGFPEELKPGLEVTMETEYGMIPVFITEVTEKTVSLDMNHPLAGMDLTFDIEVLDIRDATKEELEHGHVHTHHDHCDH